jgi:hypothetical protein
MAVPNWIEERNKLEQRFTNGDITKATRKELEWYLTVLANSLWIGLGNKEQHKEQTEAFSIVVRHLLEICLGEELHKKSHRISVGALVVAIIAVVIAAVAAVFSGFQTLNGGQNIHVTVSQPVQAISSLPQSPAIKVSPELKSPQTNGITGHISPFCPSVTVTVK